MNQHITNAPILPNGYHWKMVNYYTPDGIRKPKEVKFNHFPQATWKHEIKGFHLFELVDRNNTPVMAFCIIVQNK